MNTGNNSDFRPFTNSVVSAGGREGTKVTRLMSLRLITPARWSAHYKEFEAAACGQAGKNTWFCVAKDADAGMILRGVLIICTSLSRRDGV